MKLPEKCTVVQISQIYQQLRDIIKESPQAITFDASETFSLDISFIQLLMALEHEGIKVSIKSPTDSFQEALLLYDYQSLIVSEEVALEASS
ncbi:MAG: STAS domain-containing protein [Pseudomonadota bacterium]